MKKYMVATIEKDSFGIADIERFTHEYQAIDHARSELKMNAVSKETYVVQIFRLNSDRKYMEMDCSKYL